MAVFMYIYVSYYISIFNFRQFFIKFQLPCKYNIIMEVIDT